MTTSDFCIKCDRELSVYCGSCLEAEVQRLHERIEAIEKSHAASLRLMEETSESWRKAHLRDRVENLRAWAKSRIVHCAEVEAKYLKATRYDIPLEPVERRQEKRTLEAVLAMLDDAEQNT